MHDCRTTESRLVDLVFDELGADERLRLLAEVETCADCQYEYRSMAGTLLIFDEAAEAAMPGENYWPEHHSALRRHLEPLATRVTTARAPLWKRVLTARLPVPVPVAAVIALALLASSVLALRSPARDASPTASHPQIVAEAPPTIVEVPVYRERVVTRTVYLEKRTREKNEQGRRTPVVRRNESPLATLESESGQGGFFTRANLTDFQPANEMKIRIIKRSHSDEN